MDLATAQALRSTYLFAFDSFATDPVSVADSVKEVGNARHARECLGVLVNAGLVVQDQVNGGEDVWQTAETYDAITREEAESIIATWLESQGVESPTPQTATPRPPKATGSKPKPDANPADLPNCTCGCGAVIGRKSMYKPGHDARHAGNIAREIAATNDFTLLEALPTDALRDKAGAMAERLIDKAVAKVERATATPEPTPADTVPIQEIVAKVNEEVKAEQAAKAEGKAEAKKRTPRKSNAARNAEKLAAKNTESVASLLP